MHIQVMLAAVLCGCTASGRSPAPETAAADRPAGVARDTLTVCILPREGGYPRLVRATYDPSTGDTLVDGDSAGVIYPFTPPPYSDENEWFIQREPIVLRGRRYFQHGRPVAPVPALKSFTVYEGITVFIESDEGVEPATIFLPMRPGCVLQPYNHFGSGG